MIASVEIVHELRNRLRLRAPGREALARATAGIRSLPGVEEARANPACASLVVHYDGRPETRDSILTLAQQPPPAASEPWRPSSGADHTRLMLAGLAAVAALILPAPLARAITWANVAGVLLRGAADVLGGALKTNALDAMAIGLPTARGEFATANVTRFLLALAGYIEASTVERSDEMLRSLLRQPPGDVWVDNAGGALARVPFSRLKGGERVVVGVGETIPVDGRVLAGDAYVDQSTVTGESLPMPRSAGDQALAGGASTRTILLPEPW